MSILIDKNTRVVCQGITGKSGEFHSKNCIEYGTRLVAGVTPGKGGQTTLGVPIYDTVFEAVEKEGVNAAMIFVPAAFTGDAILEAVSYNKRNWRYVQRVLENWSVNGRGEGNRDAANRGSAPEPFDPGRYKQRRRATS